jgi:Major capsid protein 13-like
MPVVQIADVIVPAEFTAYQVENTLTSTALFQSGVAVKNGEMESQLEAGAQSFTIPYWNDPADGGEADITNDDPTILSTPLKLTAGRQVVRKSYLHQSWSEMSLASELSGSDALVRIQDRVSAYWDQQMEKRLVATLRGVLYSNVANNSGDMVNDISAGTGDAANFNGNAVIDTALTLGDRLGDVKAIAMHSAVYAEALKNNEVQFFKPSENAIEIPTYKGMAVIIDDSLTPSAGLYITVLMGLGALGFATTAPRTGYGTEIFRIPSAGNGGGQTVLHSRLNVSLHPLGLSFAGASVAGESPTIAELATASNWTRSVGRKAVPLSYLISK